MAIRACALPPWIIRAASSLPAADSPLMNTGAFLASLIMSRTCSIACDSPRRLRTTPRRLRGTERLFDERPQLFERDRFAR
jgi:hypothetical protein